MKKCVIGALCVLVFSMVWMGCKKNNTPKVVNPALDSLPSNQLNPYDSFGYRHNVILDSIAAQRCMGKKLEFEASCHLIRTFCNNKGWAALSGYQFDSIPLWTVDISENLMGFVQRMKWCDSVKVKLAALFELLVAASDDPYSLLKEKIMAFEQDILQDSFSVQEKEVVLKACSIARHSGYMWIQQPELKSDYDHQALIRFTQAHGFTTAKTSARSAKKPGWFDKVRQWVALTAIDISCAIMDLDVASGAAGSDFMRETFKAYPV